MNILVINGCPRGGESITLQTSLYLKALHPEHTFTVVHGAQRIRALERDFSPLREALSRAELVIFSYPVYTFIAPSQPHRLMELIKADGVDLRGKFVTQITTSKHFFDVTAHAWLEENCNDLGMRVIRGLSAGMEDLLKEKGQLQARQFFDQVMFSIGRGPFVPPLPAPPEGTRQEYAAHLKSVPKRGGDVVIVTNAAPEDAPLRAMIADFRAVLPFESRVVELRSFPFAGGCLGCLKCAVTGKCVYKDNFDTFLRENIQTADAFVYAFSIENHYTHSSFKCFDDRQFCNGHRTVTSGTPMGYLISGDYNYEPNLRVILEGRAEVGGNYLSGVATDEGDAEANIRSLAENLTLALDRGFTRPANFYGVGGTKIFRDLIYTMQGFMKADHKFYKEHGIYDFPQKQRGTIWKMRLVGAMMAVPAARKQMTAQMSKAMLGPYEKVLREAGKKKGAAK